MSNPTPTVALLGLGTMGTGMAQNLLKAGIALTVWNRTSAKAQPLAGAGAKLASTPAEAAASAHFVLSMLADDDASRAVWLGPEGALAAAQPGAILIESSTVTPGWIAELHIAAQARNLQLLDVPVTGSKLQAAAAQLSFIAGGSPEAFAEAEPILKPMARDLTHVGPSGSGARLKLINNFLCGVQLASLAEALAWIERSGLDRDKALAFLTSGAPGSPMLKGLSARMAAHDYTVNFLLRLMRKDLLYAQREAATAEIDLKTAATARALLEEAIAQGYGEQDMSAVIEPLRKHP